MLTLVDAKEIVLREYQLDAVEGLRIELRDGKKRLILCAPTGAGKTVLAAHLLRQADQKGGYALFLVDRVALVNQTSETLDGYGVGHGIVQGINRRWAPRENVQVCSVQTLARRSLPRSPSLIVYDEAHCFVAGTLVETPNGPRPIDEIAVGDEVYTAVGIGCVRHTFHNPANELVRVSFDDGTSVVCTPEHRFFTGDAWVQARFLDGQGAFSLESMPGLWGCLSAQDFPDGGGELVGGTRGLLEKAPLLLAELCEEIEEPDAPAIGKAANGENAAPDWAQADLHRGQRSRDYRAAAHAVAEAWRRLGSGAGYWNGSEAGQRGSEPLDNRHRQPRADDRCGGGWRQSQQPDGPREGCAKRRVPGLKRVVSVQGVECAGGRAVYNLEVSGHPSYFAGGALVHNCQYAATLKFIADHPEAVAIGLTATPFTAGMADHWEGMVNVTTTRKLIDDGFLIEPKVYIARSPDESEYSRNSFGEFSDESAASAGIKIVGDVVAEWIAKTNEHFGGPAKTIVFSPTVEHGRELCAAFAAAGFNFQQISYMDRSDEERAGKIAEFRRPDSLIHGLVSCGVLTKGFDVPDVLVGISCKPYRKSLSSHIQEIGRIMRTCPGKTKALWLDHCGNFERFAVDMYDVWDNGAGELSSAAKRDSVAREREVKNREPLKCPECGGGMRGNICTACGWERPARSEIQAVAGELKEFDPGSLGMEPRGGLRAECLKNPRLIWNAALNYCAAHTGQGEDHARRWAYGVFRGVYPGAKLPSGWYGSRIPAVVDASAYSLVERETARFRKKNPMRRAA